MDFPTYNDLQRIARDEVLAKSSALTVDIVTREGSEANALVAVGPAVGDECIGTLIEVNASLFLDTAKGTKLDRLVFDRYQLVRKPASPALGQVQFTSIAPSPGAFTIPIGTQLSTADGTVFFTITEGTYPAASSGPITVNVQSSLSGLTQQARPATITSILSTIASAPGDLRVTNALATAGADNAELDPQLRDRAKRFYTTSKRGTLKAIEVGGLAVPGVRTATAFEAIDADGDPARVVSLVVADAFTEQLIDATVLPGSYSAQSQALSTAVRDALDEVRAAGIQVVVSVAVVRLIGVTLALRFRAGADASAAATQAKVVIVNYINSLAPGQTFVHQDAQDRLMLVPGLIVLGGEIFTPAGDVVPEQLEVIRTGIAYVVTGACDHD